MVLKDRQKLILNAAIREYIRTARPISSGELAERSRYAMSPATIRSELLRLDEMGYLEQPYTSAGRTPTDKGYRFFVDNLAADETLGRKEEQYLERVFAHDHEEEFVRELGKTVAHLSKMFTATGAIDDEVFYETGLSEVLAEPEFTDQEAVRRFGQLADFLDEEMGQMLEYLGDDEDRVFIGNENPWEIARTSTMVLSSWQHPRGWQGFVAMVGPKRTNYSKHKAIIHSIRSIKLSK